LKAPSLLPDWPAKLNGQRFPYDLRVTVIELRQNRDSKVNEHNAKNLASRQPATSY